MHDLGTLPTAEGGSVPRGEPIPIGPLAPGHRPNRVLWVDASQGASGDMLLAALLDAGADAGSVAAVLDLVAPGQLQLQRRRVRRSAFSACKVDVLATDPAPTTRHLRDVRDMLGAPGVPEETRHRADRAFTLLAEAEARVHGVDIEEVHFHEVGALDSIGDIVGVCEAVRTLGIGTAWSSVVALGAGTVQSQHGLLTVPPPAVLELSRGWQVTAGGPAEVGELCTPTGLALIRALCEDVSELPPIEVDTIGVGAGCRVRRDRAGLLRVVVGRPLSSAPGPDEVQEIATNVDDLDPRLWPGILATLLDAGAVDAWLTPVVMKKGRPAQELKALVHADAVDVVADTMLRHTSTLGVRISPPQRRRVLPRGFVTVTVAGIPVRVKISRDGDSIQHASIEYRDVERLALHSGVPQRVALSRAEEAARLSDLRPGAPWPMGADQEESP